MYSGYEFLIEKLNRYKQFVNNDLQNIVLQECAESLERKVKHRIFTEGQNSLQQDIGVYSDRPISVDKSVFIKKSAFKGKKTMSLKYGYKELRNIQGLRIDKVNLKYSGELKNSIKVRRAGLSLQLISDAKNRGKVAKLEGQYKNKIFTFTNKEVEANLRNVVKKMRKTQKEIFYG